MGRTLSAREALARLPQQPPFRFVDELIELDDEHVLGAFHWRPEADFYRGHFPAEPITPGVLLIECMAQCGVVPLALRLAARDTGEDTELTTLFTDANVHFSGLVRPGDRTLTRTTVRYWRRRKLRAAVEMRLEDGTRVCTGELAGMGVAR